MQADVGDVADSGQIDILFGQLANRADGVLGPLVFVGWHKTHVALGKALFAQFGYGPDDRDAAVPLDAGPQDVFVTGTGHTVEHDAFDLHARVELDASGHYGGHGTGGFGGIEAEDHRQVEELGQFGG